MGYNMKIIISFICIVLSLIVAVFFSSDKQKNEETTTVSESTTVQWIPPGFDLVRILKESKTLGEFCDASLYYAIQSSDRVTYEQDNREDTVYSLGVDARRLISELEKNNADKKAETRQSETGEALKFDSSFNGEKGIISTYLCNDGYLYITCKDTQGNDITRAFNIGTDSYNDFMNEFHKVTCVWTPENPVTIG